MGQINEKKVEIVPTFCEAYFFQLKFAILAKDFERMKQILSKKESAIFTNIFSKTLMSEWER